MSVDDDDAWSAFASGDDHPKDTSDAPSVEYELDDWAVESREMLRNLLLGAEIAHVWQGARLVVLEEHEPRVDKLVEQVELTTLPTLDPRVDHVAFSLEGFDEAQLDVLQQRLGDAEIPFEFDTDGELVVEAPDGDAVEELLEALDYPDALDPDAPLGGGGDDGDAVDDSDLVDIDPDEVIGGMFLAAGRLARNARDADAVVRGAELAEVIAGARMPFGYQPAVWKAIQQGTATLLAQLGDDAVTDDEVEEHAASLREQLRDLV